MATRKNRKQRAVEQVSHRLRITTPAELRGVLILGLEGLLEGRIDVHRANAMARIAEQIHSSIDKEWEMRCYAAQNFAMKAGEVVKLIELPETIDE